MKVSHSAGVHTDCRAVLQQLPQDPGSVNSKKYHGTCCRPQTSVGEAVFTRHQSNTQSLNRRPKHHRRTDENSIQELTSLFLPERWCLTTSSFPGQSGLHLTYLISILTNERVRKVSEYNNAITGDKCPIH